MKKLSCILICLSSAINTNAQISEFSWLIGTWQEKGKSNFEVWQWGNDELKAESFEQKSDGTKRVMEKITLLKRGADYFFVPNVAHNGKPIEFKITSFGENGFISENPQHDFPKKITYKKISDGEFHATIADDKKTISYFFEKVKVN
jgi:Domain of unknown function (DUF6265)